MTSRLQGLSDSTRQRVSSAGAALDAGRLDAASQSLAAIPPVEAGHPEVLRMRAGVHSLRGQHQEAIATMRQAMTQRPDDALYCNTLGTIYGNAGNYDAAVEVLQRACQLQPGLALAWFNLGVMLVRGVRNDEAEAALHRAVELDPGQSTARALLGDQLRNRGAVDEAAAQYRQIIARQPWAGQAWWGLADLKTTRFADDDIQRMQAAMQRPEAGDDDLIAIGFALAKALEDAGRYAESLAALARANGVARRRQAWDAAGFSASVAAVEAAFTPAPPGAAEPTLGHEVIFITSLPRSGSTLVEQILASHSGVEGAGELVDLPAVLAEESQRRGQPFPRWVPHMQPEDWERLGRRYLKRSRRWQGRRARFTDKLPNNWIYLGAIRAMLPGAHVIACRRDPLETCLSCYRQRFAGNEYTRTFEDLASFWHDFDRSIRHWAALHPGHVLEHSYEDLLADAERSIRRLLDFCDLPFEAACLQFHATRRDVRSPSATQVRQPLQRDTARAPRYGALIDPLRTTLGYPPFAGSTG
jgi:tetratricopeptide (TPR) repeat protein